MICRKEVSPCLNYHRKKYNHFGSRICHRDQELISTLTPEQFFALLSHDYDTGFSAGKASAQKEILCMLAADGMPVEKIALLLQMKTEMVREIMAAKPGPH